MDGPPFKDPEMTKFAPSPLRRMRGSSALRPLAVPDCEFEIGELGSDNAIAHRILRTGRTPVNAPDRFRIFHYDQFRGKVFLNQSAVHGGASTRPPVVPS